MCMSAKAPPAPPPPEAPPPPPTVLDTKVESTRNRQTRARVQGGPSSAMSGAGLTPQVAGASPVLGT
jgi:hypothetical protein